MEAKPTPGPWEYDGVAVRRKGSIVGHQIAQPQDPDDPMHQTETERANGHLIAAAPDLLAALSVISLDPKISAWLKANDPNALKQARDAIGKV